MCCFGQNLNVTYRTRVMDESKQKEYWITSQKKNLVNQDKRRVRILDSVVTCSRFSEYVHSDEGG